LEHIVYIFEGFRLDAGRRQLSSSGGVVVPLNSRATEALLLLVSCAGELVTKKQLLAGVWPSAVVEENNINQCILAIRKALGESAGSNRFIMTVTGRGYRFVAPVTAQTRESADVPAAGITIDNRARVWKIATACALAAGILLAIIAGRPRTVAPEPDAEADEIVVHLRGGKQIAAPGVAALLDCLRQRPDLHLQVDVHVVGSSSGQPVWTGKYLAGAQDLSEPSRSDSPKADASEGEVSSSDACRPLAMR
jgi:DNA-binding winged helix-turn-helix (wHTH) protein